MNDNELLVIENKLIEYFKDKIKSEKAIAFKDERRMIFDLIIESKNTVFIEFKNLSGLEIMPSSYALNFIKRASLMKNISRNKKAKLFVITNSIISSKLENMMKKEGIVFLTTKSTSPEEIVDIVIKYSQGELG